MTEISSSTSRVTTSQADIAPVSNRAKTEAQAKQSSPAAQAAASSIERQREKIFAWFSRAGIGTGKHQGEKRNIRQRTQQRQSLRAEQRLANLERIMLLAGDFALSNGNDDTLDPDWFYSFIDMAEDIYAPKMQELWAKILAVEVGKPGSFTLRTLQTLKQLTQKDARILEHAASLIGHQAGGSGPKIISGYSAKPSIWSVLGGKRHVQINLAEYGLTYPQILAMVDMGLLYSSEIESGQLPAAKGLVWRFGQARFELAARRAGLVLKYYKFTHTGGELMRLIRSQTNDNYLQSLQTALSNDFSVAPAKD